MVELNPLVLLLLPPLRSPLFFSPLRSPLPPCCTSINMTFQATLLFLCLCSSAMMVVDAAASCEQRCINSGNCCTGNSSGCQHPSCQIGCVIGAGSSSVADCNATCLAAKGCSFTFKGQTFQMCGGCSARWVDPQTLQPAVLPGEVPYWPPGYGYPGCGSCDTTQCQLGCMMAFDS